MSFGCQRDMDIALLTDKLDVRILYLDKQAERETSFADNPCTCTTLVGCGPHRRAALAKKKADEGRAIWKLLGSDDFEPAAKKFLSSK